MAMDVPCERVNNEGGAMRLYITHSICVYTSHYHYHYNPDRYDVSGRRAAQILADPPPLCLKVTIYLGLNTQHAR